MRDKVYAFSNESDFRRVGAAVKIVEKIHSTGMQAPTHVKQDATYAKITALVSGSDDKEATGTEVFFNGATKDFSEITTDPIVYDDDASQEDGATVFSTSNISSKTAMAVDDIVKIASYPNLSDTSDWLVEETGGSARAYVVITAVTDAANYIGDILTGPGGDVVTAGVSIVVFGATENPLSIGYPNFADLVDGVYYLNGDLLD